MDYLQFVLFTQAVINGVLLGLIYTAMAVGLSLTMGIMGIVNVAHSTFIILGSYATFELSRQFGMDPLVSLVVVIPLFFIIGALLERGLMQHVAKAAPTIGLLILFGVLVVLESVAILIWTTDTQVINTNYGPSIILGDFIIARPRLFAGIAALIMVGLTYYLLQKTMMGKGIRAMAQNRDAATMMGINVERLSMIVFGIGTATAAVGGVALAMVFPFTPQDHIRWLAWAFLVVIVGGLGNVRNTLIAGLVVGLTETLSGVFLPFQFVPVVIYSFLALALVIRGQGLAGTESRTI